MPQNAPQTTVGAGLSRSTAAVAPETGPTVRFEGVGMRYGRAPEVLRDLDLTLTTGSFQFLTGASGAGKSSLLKLIYLAHRPSRGLVSLFGRDIASTPRDGLPLLRRRMGVVFQEFRLLEHLSVFDNAALPLRLAGIRPRDYHDDVAELLAWVGLGSRLEAQPATLSGGEKQRLAIARVLLKAPDIVILDEATAHLDSESEAAVQQALSAALTGRTSLVIAHRLSTVRSADQILVIDGGKVVESGRHAELIAAGGLYADLYRTQFEQQA